MSSQECAKWKIAAGASAFGVISVLSGWDKLGGWNSAERVVFVSSWIISVWVALVIACKLPKLHKRLGIVLLLCAVAGGILVCAKFVVGDYRDACRWLVCAIHASYGARIFLRDPDVRNFRTEYTRSSDAA
ncbi:MAG: hypothetical protein EOP84_22415 [Verrucomicrobiaceae bacterium]|nr:MAG: hypothetical protein EOP84_22415 [Verrucomicrobiaceae bacterium]